MKLPVCVRRLNGILSRLASGAQLPIQSCQRSMVPWRILRAPFSLPGMESRSARLHWGRWMRRSMSSGSDGRKCSRKRLRWSLNYPRCAKSIMRLSCKSAVTWFVWRNCHPRKFNWKRSVDGWKQGCWSLRSQLRRTSLAWKRVVARWKSDRRGFSQSGLTWELWRVSWMNWCSCRQPINRDAMCCSNWLRPRKAMGRAHRWCWQNAMKHWALWPIR